MYRGGASGSAVPLVWAHSEYLRLLRSSHDKAVFDLIPEVERRYLKEKPKSKFEFWMPKHPINFAHENCTLRVCAPEKFRLRWSADSWATWQDIRLERNGDRGGILRLTRIGSRGRGGVHVLLDVPRCLGRPQPSSRGET